MEDIHLFRRNSEDNRGHIQTFAVLYICISLPQLPTSDTGTVMLVSFSEIICVKCTRPALET